MKALIIDDERLARQELKLLLSAHPQVIIVGEADTVDSAVLLVQQHQPDVLFLDVQLRGGTGFEVIDRLPEPRPLVVFCTAHEQHAVSAFDSEALDYLLKPLAPVRLGRTVLKLESVLEAAVVEAPGQVLHASLDEGSMLLLREGERHQLATVRDILFIASEGNYCRVHLVAPAATSFLLCRSLQNLEQRLPASMFFRVSRSQIVNLSRISAIEPWFSQSLKARLTNGEDVEFSRRAAQAFRDRFSL